MLIGMTLIADGAGLHVPKGYIYAAIGFSVGVEALNQLLRVAAGQPPKPAPAGKSGAATGKQNPSPPLRLRGEQGNRLSPDQFAR